MSAPRFVVYATIRGVGPIPCGRPYPREDHCDAFGWENEGDALAHASRLIATFPDCDYLVVAETKA